MGQLFTLQGKDHVPLQEIGPGDIGAVAKLKEVATGDVLATGEPAVAFPPIAFPPPLMSFAVTARNLADEDKLHSSLRRMSDEDPTLDVHRDDQTGDLHRGRASPRCTWRSSPSASSAASAWRWTWPRRTCPTGRPSPARPRPRASTRSRAAAGASTATAGSRWSRCRAAAASSSSTRSSAEPSRGTFIPAVEKGVVEAMQAGELAGHPVVDVRVTLYDGKHHAVDSSEMAFKIAGSLGMKAAIAKAGPVLLEPVMRVEVTVPSEHVGDVMGDLNSRRGHPLGMETRGQATRSMPRRGADGRDARATRPTCAP